MSDPYLGEIRLWAGSFCPMNWNYCDGSMLSTSTYPALFGLIGTTYGGTESQFAVPDLRSRVPIHTGSGFTLGQNGGQETVTLSAQQNASHTHAFVASNSTGIYGTPGGNLLAATNFNLYYAGTPAVALNGASVTSAGGSAPHPNLQPFLGLSYIICLEGIYPDKSN